MTTILLIRHATAGHVGRTLPGRSPGINLDEDGRAEARALADALAGWGLAAIYSSPLERTRETAALLAAPHGLDPRLDDAFVEVDVGDWTGLDFGALQGREDWRRWNERRSVGRPPGGESMPEVTERALAGVRSVAERHEGETVAVVTHCDVIRPLLGHYLGFSIDHFHHLRIDTASVSTVELHDRGAVVTGVNWRVGAL
jgi:broad specificity phosphatase PhoE